MWEEEPLDPWVDLPNQPGRIHTPVQSCFSLFIITGMVNFWNSKNLKQTNRTETAFLKFHEGAWSCHKALKRTLLHFTGENMYSDVFKIAVLQSLAKICCYRLLCWQIEKESRPGHSVPWAQLKREGKRRLKDSRSCPEPRWVPKSKQEKERPTQELCENGEMRHRVQKGALKAGGNLKLAKAWMAKGSTSQ